MRAGDSLAGIAAQLWGDSSLWYRLAEANGLSAASALAEGQSLTVPAGVTNSKFNASTFKPYDPAETVGETSPTSPKPNKKSNKCGTFGIILLVAVAVAVTVVTSGALAAASIAAVSGTSVSLGAGLTALGGMAVGGVSLTTVGMIAIGATAAAVGSIASQGLGVATGIQDKFSWKGVAMAALAGGISGGLGAAIPGSQLNTLSTIGRGAVLGVGSSALSQGIGVAVGLQKKFDFAGVAAAGLAGGVSAGVGKALGVRSLTDMSARNIGANLASSSAGGIVNAATRSLINGTDFGDNLMAALPDILGSTIGNLIAGAVVGRPRPPAQSVTRTRTLTQILEEEFHITAEMQRRAWEADAAAFDRAMNGGGLFDASSSTMRPTHRPRFATGWDFDNSGGLSWGDVTGGLATGIEYVTGRSPGELLGEAQSLLGEVYEDIVVTAQRIPLVETITDWIDYVQTVVTTRPTPPAGPNYASELATARANPRLNPIASPGRLGSGINEYVIRPINNVVAHGDATVSYISRGRDYAQGMARYGVESVVHRAGQSLIGTINSALSPSGVSAPLPVMAGPGRVSIGGFAPPPLSVDRHGRLTNGAYTLDRDGMAPHVTGRADGRSQFLYRLDADSLTLDAAAYADRMGLWTLSDGTKAKVTFPMVIGVTGRAGNPTSVLNIYRSGRGMVHSAPGN